MYSDKEKDIQAATEKIRQELNESYKKQEELSTEILSLKVRDFLFFFYDSCKLFSNFLYFLGTISRS